MEWLEPAPGVEILESGSTLFTDHAEKQRLVKLLTGKRMRANGDALPEFPDGTIIAKTFYYPVTEKKQRTLNINQTGLESPKPVIGLPPERSVCTADNCCIPRTFPYPNCGLP